MGIKMQADQNELKILKLLLENQGKLSRQALMRSLWDEEVYVNENTLTVNVNASGSSWRNWDLSLSSPPKEIGYVIL